MNALTQLDSFASSDSSDFNVRITDFGRHTTRSYQQFQAKKLSSSFIDSIREAIFGKKLLVNCTFYNNFVFIDARLDLVCAVSKCTLKVLSRIDYDADLVCCLCNHQAKVHGLLKGCISIDDLRWPFSSASIASSYEVAGGVVDYLHLMCSRVACPYKIMRNCPRHIIDLTSANCLPDACSKVLHPLSGCIQDRISVSNANGCRSIDYRFHRATKVFEALIVSSRVRDCSLKLCHIGSHDLDPTVYNAVLSKHGLTAIRDNADRCGPKSKKSRQQGLIPVQPKLGAGQPPSSDRSHAGIGSILVERRPAQVRPAQQHHHQDHKRHCAQAQSCVCRHSAPVAFAAGA